jgi:hypothetical protein
MPTITRLEAVPLVRHDQPWQALAVFWADPEKTAVEDLTGKTVLAQIRWLGDSQDVTVTVPTPTNGQVTLSLTKEQTADMPLGRLATLYIAVGTVTRAIGPIEIEEGLFLE